MADKFVEYGGKRFPLDASMTLEQAKDVMARHFPELADPKIVTKKEDDVTVYVFTKQAGRKGARRGGSRSAPRMRAVLDNLLAVQRFEVNPAWTRLCISHDIAAAGDDVPSVEALAGLARALDLQAAQVSQIVQALRDLPTTRAASGSIL